MENKINLKWNVQYYTNLKYNRYNPSVSIKVMLDKLKCLTKIQLWGHIMNKVFPYTMIYTHYLNLIQHTTQNGNKYQNGILRIPSCSRTKHRFLKEAANWLI